METDSNKPAPPKRDFEYIRRQSYSEQLGQSAGRRVPAWVSVTNLIIAANLVAFVVMGVLGAGWIQVADIMPYIRYGANRADVTTDGEWWRLLSSMFLHYGIIHLLLNMWALYQTGPVVERFFGRAAYVLAYFGSGLAGSITTLLWHREKLTWSAGASGAVFGLFGALMGYMLREKKTLPKGVFQPLLTSTLSFAGYNILFGLINPQIDNAAHLGGLAGGVLLGWLLALPIDHNARAQFAPRRLLLGGAAAALIVAIGTAAAPRYDYRLKDEIALADANQAPIAKEPLILEQQRAAITGAADIRNPAEVSRWLAEEAVPFYAHWVADLGALQLAPGRSTAVRRDELVHILMMRITAYQHLLGALARNDNTALSAFRTEQQTIEGELKKISGRGK